MKRVGINGFGRIGRTIFRQYLNSVDSGCKIVAINNPLRKGESISDYIHLLKYDSVHGRLNDVVKAEDGGFSYNGNFVKFFTEMDPANIDWESLQVDIVVDSTGIFKDKQSLGKHRAKKIIMSAPGDDLDLTIVLGVNDDKYDPKIHHIVSNASCTTNCLAPIAKVIDQSFSIVSGIVTTVHSYTADQRLVDSNHDDLRRARAANLSMVPTKTGAAKAVGLVLPHLKGKLEGFAIRVPTPNVSVVDATFQVAKETTRDEVNRVLKEASQSPAMKGILGFSTEELVSVDFNGSTESSIVDAKYTMVMNGNLVKVLSWYDNETGYSSRILDLIKKM